MNVMYHADAQTDILYWLDADKRTLAKILHLVKEITRTPYEGSGQPEPLKYHLNGLWSRRISAEHRLVYAVREEENCVDILSCRGHYY